MTDAEIITILHRAGISSLFYEGEVGETNLPMWHKLAEGFKEYYDYERDAREQQSTDVQP